MLNYLRSFLQSMSLKIKAATFALVVTVVGTANAETVRLLCAAPETGQFAKTFNVDFSARTVNGLKASISDAEIKWESRSRDILPGRDLIVDNTINRLNGNFSSYTRPGQGVWQSGPAPSIVCNKAPAAKF